MNLELALDDRPEQSARTAVIDAALHHVENQAVLRDLLAGKISWGQVFGLGGQCGPNMAHWDGDAKGIHWHTADGIVLIRPAEILARAREISAASVATVESEMNTTEQT